MKKTILRTLFEKINAYTFEKLLRTSSTGYCEFFFFNFYFGLFTENKNYSSRNEAKLWHFLLCCLFWAAKSFREVKPRLIMTDRGDWHWSGHWAPGKASLIILGLIIIKSITLFLAIAGWRVVLYKGFANLGSGKWIRNLEGGNRQLERRRYLGRAQSWSFRSSPVPRSSTTYLSLIW